jgi:hypothetical protein
MVVRADDASIGLAVSKIKDARVVPLMKDGVFIGLKVYAIRPSGRFDQPSARFHNGDMIDTIDGEKVTSDAGARRLHDNVIEGKADAVVVVRRGNQLVTLTSKAMR